MNVAEQLHAHNGVDEEQHGDEEDDVGQGLERLDERPQEDPDGVALPEELDQTGGSEQTQEAHVDEVFLKKHVDFFKARK